MGSGRDTYREEGRGGEKRRDFVQWRGGEEEGGEGRREEGGQGRRDQVQLRREEVTGREALGVAERGEALPTMLVKLYYLTFGFSQGH